MAQASIGLVCTTCGRQTLHVESTRVNHVLHFLLGVLTCSLWWFVWLMIVLGHEPQYACSQCGTVYVKPQPVIDQRQWTEEEREAHRKRGNKSLVMAVALIVGVFALMFAASGGFRSRNASSATDRMLAALPRATATATATPSATPSPRPKPQVTRRTTPAPVATATPDGEISEKRALVTASNAAKLYHTNLKCPILASYPGPVNEIARAEAISDGLRAHDCSE